MGAGTYGLKASRSNTTASHRTNSDDDCAASGSGGDTSHTSHTFTPNIAERGDKERGEKHGEMNVHDDALNNDKNTRMLRKFEEVPPITISYLPYIDTPFVPHKPGYLKRFGTVTRHTQPKSAGVRGVFEPLTSVDEPIVSRVQLQVFYLAVVWATIFAAVGGTLAIVL